jgi:hypothetical protein
MKRDFPENPRRGGPESNSAPAEPEQNEVRFLP